MTQQQRQRHIARIGKEVILFLNVMLEYKDNKTLKSAAYPQRSGRADVHT